MKQIIMAQLIPLKVLLSAIQKQVDKNSEDPEVKHTIGFLAEVIQIKMAIDIHGLHKVMSIQREVDKQQDISNISLN